MLTRTDGFLTRNIVTSNIGHSLTNYVAFVLYLTLFYFFIFFIFNQSFKRRCYQQILLILPCVQCYQGITNIFMLNWSNITYCIRRHGGQTVLFYDRSISKLKFQCDTLYCFWKSLLKHELINGVWCVAELRQHELINGFWWVTALRQMNS